MMQIIGSFAEFERAILRERTKNGLITARKEGRMISFKFRFLGNAYFET